ncbi:MAG: MFS transporter [Thermodesulfobacteriota bacterium]|nr:MFS transporter [Thermodesulfobacteriota bacterium]
MMNLKALILLTAGHFVTDINTGALPAYLPFIKESLTLSYTMTAFIVLIFNVTSSVIQPVFGYFSDRWSAKWLLPTGCVIASLGLGFLGIGPSYGWVLLFAALGGLGQGSYHPEAFKTVNSLSGEKKASGISFFLVGGSLGLSVGPLLATLFFKYLGLKGSLLFLPPGIAMAIIFLTTPSWRAKTSPPPHKSKTSLPPGSSRPGLFPMTLLLLTVILRSTTQLSIKTFVPLYFIHSFQKDPLIVGKFLSTYLLAGTFGSLVGGVLADRYGYKRTVILSLGLTPFLLYLFFYTTGITSLVLLGIAGLVLSSSTAITMAMGQSYMPRNLGMASGLILGLAMGIGGVGTMLLGWVADQWGVIFSLRIVFILPLLSLLPFFYLPSPTLPNIRKPPQPHL